MKAVGTPVRRSLVVFTWDGGSLDHICFDSAPDFDILLFDFTGRATRPDEDWAFLSEKTECKGDVLRVVGHYLRRENRLPEYVALFDHDVRTRISDLNCLLDIARREQLDSFAPALTQESYFSYPQFLTHRCSLSSGESIRRIRWVEVMMPFYRSELFLAGTDFYERSITAYGIDSFVIPMFQKVLNMENVAVIDHITVTHTQPVSSGKRRCSNGLTPYQERVNARRECLDWLAVNRPDLVGTAWYYQTFAPLDGPVRFWLLRLGWPWHALRRMAEASPSRRRARHCSTKPI